MTPDNDKTELELFSKETSNNRSNLRNRYRNDYETSKWSRKSRNSLIESILKNIVEYPISIRSSKSGSEGIMDFLDSNDGGFMSYWLRDSETVKTFYYYASYGYDTDKCPCCGVTVNILNCMSRYDLCDDCRRDEVKSDCVFITGKVADDQLDW